MANDNETVEQVALSDRPLAEQIRIIRGNYCIGSGEFDALDEAADVVECHQREIGELKGELKGILNANEAFAVDNTRLRGELAEKDEEIGLLRKFVGKLAEIVDGPICHQDCASCPHYTKCQSKRLRSLVAMAREVAK